MDDLIQRARNGDGEAFATLFEHSKQPLWRAAMAVLGNVDDASDALQETAVKAWRAMPRFGGRSAVNTWFMRILLRVCYDMRQMCIRDRCNAEAARVWHELGASRVVCAREMSVEDIARLRAGAPRELELEAFVHGAMCMAVSGRCLISAALTGRSGNKGHCTQPCRWSYALVEEQRPGEFFPVEEDVRGTYVMNAQDLNMLAHLDDLAAAGIDSFKIEGRNKKAFYVASVVRAYRLALDGVPSSELADELLAVSHRPYGTGFYYGDARQSPDVDGYTAECRHAATVEACEPAGEGAFRVIARCYNRFCEGDELEALSPGPHVPLVRVRNLAWLPAPDGDDAQPKRVPVAVANRSAERYAFETGEELAPGDFLRMRINVER